MCILANLKNCLKAVRGKRFDMDFITNFSLCLLAAIILSFCVSFIYLCVMALIVAMFQLNYEKDAYWVFSGCFYIFFISLLVILSLLIGLKLNQQSARSIFLNKIAIIKQASRMNGHERVDRLSSPAKPLLTIVTSSLGRVYFEK